MPFKPVKKESQDLPDRWLIFGLYNKRAMNWVKRNCIPTKTQTIKHGSVIAAPIFDPVDQIEFQAIETTIQSYGRIYYEVVFLSETQSEELTPYEKAIIVANERLHPQGPRYGYPHRQPTMEQHDRLDFRRKYVAPDPLWIHERVPGRAATLLFPSLALDKDHRVSGSE